MVYTNLGWLCSHAMPLLVFAITCLCVTGMTNIINVQYTSVYRRLFSSITRGGDCKHYDFLCLACPPFFDDVKRGKMGMKIVGIVCLVLS